MENLPGCEQRTTSVCTKVGLSRPRRERQVRRIFQRAARRSETATLMQVPAGSLCGPRD
jgi:hypothetical protein